MKPWSWGVAVAGALACAGCGGSTPAGALAQAPAFEPEDQTKCKIRKSQSRPLIVEWPAADRAALEAIAKRGLVLVRYEGCEMEILAQCSTRGDYEYTAITRKDDRVSIKTEDDLWANVPLGAAALESTLAKAGELDVGMSLVGRYQSNKRDVRADELEGRCDEATHVINALTVGAFEFYAGASAEIGAGAGVMGVGAEASSNAERKLLNRDGDLDACGEATTEDQSPPEGCGALLRVEVAPIAPAGSPAAAPPAAGAEAGAPAAAGPSGLTAGKGRPKVHLETSMQFLQLFRLGVGVIPIHTPQGTVYQAQNEGVCTAPCDQVIDGTRGDRFGLYNDQAWVGEPFRLDQAPAEVKIQAEPDREASTFLGVSGFIGLITGSLGMAYGLVNVLFNGIQSTSDTSASDTEVFGPVEAGVVGLAGGATVLVGGILMMVLAKPTFDVDYSEGVTVDARRSRPPKTPPGTLFTF